MSSTGFGFESTADDVLSGVDLSGRRAIVTGGSSGIGVETSRALAGAGADVTLAVRDTTAGEQRVVDIVTTTGNPSVRVARLDLADQASVAAFVEDWNGPLHMLINNAGVMGLPSLQLTTAGWELHFATNHLGHFALTRGLHDALATAGDARIVMLSSRQHLLSRVVFEDVHFESRPYHPRLAYGQSKTAVILLAVEATRRWHRYGITANAVNPGPIPDTNVSRHQDPDVRARSLAELRATGEHRFKTIEQGAATSVLVAASPQLQGIGGRYFEDCNEAGVVDPTVSNLRDGVADYAIDAANAERLWELSEQLLG